MQACLLPPRAATLAIADSKERFYVRRIYCVGRNYAAHTREMGGDPTREAPFFFCKPADSIKTAESSGVIDFNYPSATADLHHEVELVVALHSGGRDIPAHQAGQHIFGYGVGIDMTRRDLQADMKAKGRPWEIGKAFDQSAPMGELVPAKNGPVPNARIEILVNGKTRQISTLDQMIWSVDEIIANLSTLFELMPGDLIYTGTPEGVAALKVGDDVSAEIEGLPRLLLRVLEPL
jgi:fumarylpyruvate hydrolase